MDVNIIHKVIQVIKFAQIFVLVVLLKKLTNVLLNVVKDYIKVKNQFVFLIVVHK